MLLRFASRLFPSKPLFLSPPLSRFCSTTPTHPAFQLLETIRPSHPLDPALELSIPFSQYQQHELFQHLQKSSTHPTTPPLPPIHLIQSLHHLTQPRYIHPTLYMLYPSISANTLSDSSLTFIFQKILTYQPPTLPPPPPPRTLTNNELLFFILTQLYPPSQLYPWLDNIPLWDNENNTLLPLAMAVFTMYEKSNKQLREKHQNKFKKAIEVIENNMEPDIGDEMVSILVLALEMNNPLAETILSQKLTHLEELPAEQIALVFANSARYSPNNERSKVVDKIMEDIVEHIITLDWRKLTSVNVMDFWRVLHERPACKGVWFPYLTKLSSYTESLLTHKSPTTTTTTTTQSASEPLSTHTFTPEDLVYIIETLDKHFVNKKKLLHEILHKLESHLMTLPPGDLVRLVKAMCIYVKLEEGYFMHLRGVCDKRKMEFTVQEVKELRKVYARFGVLFSQPF